MSSGRTVEPKLQALVFCPGPMGILEQSLALEERGWLQTMAIDYYCDLSRSRFRWIPEGRIKKFLRRRYHPRLNSRLVRTHPLPSVITKIGTIKARTAEGRNRWVFWHNAQFDAWVAKRLHEFGNLAFGYESASLSTFRRAKELGIPRVLYQPNVCAEKLKAVLEEERQLFPALADTMRGDWYSDQEMQQRREERQFADAILCASNFTKQSLIEVGVEPEKIFVEPYGVDQTAFTPSTEKFANFSVVWASSYTHTKGIGYLLEALTREPVPGIELVLAGHPYGTDAVAKYEDRVRVRRVGFLSREELSKVMPQCHAHVFPTLLEGFGRNIIEAMAAGLPVITTPNCAGPDLIEEGVTGFIVPIRDVDAICERLAWVHDHPHEALEMGERARERVSSLTQADYRQRFSNRINGVWERQSS